MDSRRTSLRRQAKNSKRVPLRGFASYGNAHTQAWLAIMTTGNAVGGMLLPTVNRAYKTLS